MYVCVAVRTRFDGVQGQGEKKRLTSQHPHAPVKNDFPKVRWVSAPRPDLERAGLILGRFVALVVKLQVRPDQT